MTTSEREVEVSASVCRLQFFLPADTRWLGGEENDKQSQQRMTRLGNFRASVRNEMLPHPAASSSQLLI